MQEIELNKEAKKDAIADIQHFSGAKEMRTSVNFMLRCYSIS